MKENGTEDGPTEPKRLRTDPVNPSGDGAASRQPPDTNHQAHDVNRPPIEATNGRDMPEVPRRGVTQPAAGTLGPPMPHGPYPPMGGAFPPSWGMFPGPFPQFSPHMMGGPPFDFPLRGPFPHWGPLGPQGGFPMDPTGMRGGPVPGGPTGTGAPRGSHQPGPLGSGGPPDGLPAPIPPMGGGGPRGQGDSRGTLLPVGGPPGGGGFREGPRGPGSSGPLRGRTTRGAQNDYSQHFVDTGYRPQNFVRDMDMGDRFEEYPKLKELLTRKDEIVAANAHPPVFHQMDLKKTELSASIFGTRFDAILIDPPWEEYVRRAPGVGDDMGWWTPEDIMGLKIEAIADNPSFVFLWVGDAEGLEHGRACFKKWGFRRCEDISWVKTNRNKPDSPWGHSSDTLFQHSKEHCLMGIKGTVRRSTDGHIIHANIDTDVLISEQPPYGSTRKPDEMYNIVEHFVLGRRRIELFGEDHNIRAGWLTIGKDLTSSNFNPEAYLKFFAGPDGKVWQGGRGNPPPGAPHLMGTSPEIEALRPKSPPPRGGPQAAATGAAAGASVPPQQQQQQLQELQLQGQKQ